MTRNHALQVGYFSLYSPSRDWFHWVPAPPPRPWCAWPDPAFSPSSPHHESLDLIPPNSPWTMSQPHWTGNGDQYACNVNARSVLFFKSQIYRFNFSVWNIHRNTNVLWIYWHFNTLKLIVKIGSLLFFHFWFYWYLIRTFWFWFDQLQVGSG